MAEQYNPHSHTSPKPGPGSSAIPANVTFLYLFLI